MKRYIVFFLFIIFALSVFGEIWNINPVVKNIGNRDIAYYKNAPDSLWSDITVEGTSGYLPIYGAPKVPVFRKIYYLPKGSYIEAKVTSKHLIKNISLDNPLIPRVHSARKIKGEVPVFEYNEESYKTVFPQFDVKVNKKGIVRGMEVWEVVACPVKYIDNTVYVYDMEIEINKEEGVYDNRLYSKAFDNFYKENGIKGVLPLPMKILFICPNAYRDTLQRYADWKWEMGYDVVVATEDSISNWTFDGIKAYIQDAYDNWTVPPTFVILVGDVDNIPTDTVTISSTTFNSDLGYYLLDGTDFYPDVYGGRISVESDSELSVVIDKMLLYERGTFTTGNWMENAQFIGSSDPTYYTVSEGTHNYVIDTLSLANDYGFTCYRVYPKTNGGDEQDIANNINSGVLYNIYSGHGDPYGYADYDITFDVDSINILLHNGEMLPFCATHACQTHDFDASGVSGGEGWLRKADGGAFTSWGATIYTYWDEDDTLERAWFRSCFYDSNWVIGQFTQDGLHAVDNSGSSLNEYYFYEYHILGDPSIMLRSKRVDTMAVSYSINSGFINVTVNDNDGITPISNAMVCVNDGSTSSSSYTDNTGSSQMDISGMASPIIITVTAHDYMYWQDTVNISAPNPPVVINPMLDSWLNSSLVNMKFYGTDPDNDSISYRILWSKDPYFTDADTEYIAGIYASGDTVLYTSSYSFEDTVYYYEIQGIDVTGDSVWSMPSVMRELTINNNLTEEGWYQTVDEQFARSSLYFTTVSNDVIEFLSFGYDTVDISVEDTNNFVSFTRTGDSYWHVVSDTVFDNEYSFGVNYSIPYSEAWLIIKTPLVIGQKDTLLFYEYGKWTQWMNYHGLLFSNSTGSVDNFEEISNLSVPIEGEWKETKIALDSIANEIGYFAFCYKGENADNWYIDNIKLLHSYIPDSGMAVSYPVYADSFYIKPSSYGTIIIYKRNISDSIGVEIEGFDGTNWNVIKEKTFSSDSLITIDCSDVSTDSFPAIRLVAYFYKNDSGYPAIESWGVSPGSSFKFVKSYENNDNPMCGVVNDIMYLYGGRNDIVKVKIYDITGRMVFNDNVVLNSNEEKIRLPLVSGAYFYLVENKEKMQKGKFLIVH